MYADAMPIAAEKTRDQIDSITSKIIGAAQKVSGALGNGFLERVYENALAMELGNLGMAFKQQEPCLVSYEGEVVGTYVVDLLVEDCVVIEIKAQVAIERSHVAQCVHYLRATTLRVALLLNFGRPRLEWRRVVHRF
jgi:GxxExxY protein